MCRGRAGEQRAADRHAECIAQVACPRTRLPNVVHLLTVCEVVAMSGICSEDLSPCDINVWGRAPDGGGEGDVEWQEGRRRCHGLAGTSTARRRLWVKRGGRDGLRQRSAASFAGGAQGAAVRLSDQRRSSAPVRVRLGHIGRLDPCGEVVLFRDATSRHHAFSYPPSAPSCPPSSDPLRTMSKAEDKPVSRPNKLRRPHSPSPPDEDGDRTGSETRQPPPKRARKAINCEPCRNSKLKCDRYVRLEHRRPLRPNDVSLT